MAVNYLWSTSLLYDVGAFWIHMTKLWCSDRWAALLRQPNRANFALQAEKSLNLQKEMPQKNTMICTNHLSIQTYQQTSTEHNSSSAIFTESEVTSGPAAWRKVAGPQNRRKGRSEHGRFVSNYSYEHKTQPNNLIFTSFTEKWIRIDKMHVHVMKNEF